MFNPNRRSVILTLLFAGTLTPIATALIAPALPAMQAHFSGVPQSSLLVRLVLTLPALFIVLSAPFAGLFTDRLGRMPILIASIALYGLAGISGYFAPTLPWLLAGRAVLGMAVAGILTAATTLIADYYQGDQRARVLGWQAAVIGVAGALALLAAGFLADIGWRNTFLIYSVAFAVLPFAVVLLQEPDRVQLRQAVASDEILPPATLRLILAIYAILIVAQVLYFMVPVQIPFVLVPRDDVSQALQTGIAVASLALAFSVGSLLSHRVTGMIGRRATIVAGFLLVGSGYVLVGRTASLPIIFGAMAIVGFALGLWLPLLNVWLAEITPESFRGRALGGMTTARYLGQFSSPILLQPLVNQVNVGPTFLIVGIGALIVGLGTIALTAGANRRHRAEPTADSN